MQPSAKWTEHFVVRESESPRRVHATVFSSELAGMPLARWWLCDPDPRPRIFTPASLRSGLSADDFCEGCGGDVATKAFSPAVCAFGLRPGSASESVGRLWMLGGMAKSDEEREWPPSEHPSRSSGSTGNGARVLIVRGHDRGVNEEKGS